MEKGCAIQFPEPFAGKCLSAVLNLSCSGVSNSFSLGGDGITVGAVPHLAYRRLQYAPLRCSMGPKRSAFKQVGAEDGHA